MYDINVHFKEGTLYMYKAALFSSACSRLIYGQFLQKCLQLLERIWSHEPQSCDHSFHWRGAQGLPSSKCSLLTQRGRSDLGASNTASTIIMIDERNAFPFYTLFYFYFFVRLLIQQGESAHP